MIAYIGQSERKGLSDRMMLIQFKYTFQAFQKDHFWLPVGAYGLVQLIITVFIPETNKYNTARAFPGFYASAHCRGTVCLRVSWLINALSCSSPPNVRPGCMIFEPLGDHICL